ncbi:unnamed protein product [Hapterophycus canaliculatus]
MTLLDLSDREEMKRKLSCFWCRAVLCWMVFFVCGLPFQRAVKRTWQVRRFRVCMLCFETGCAEYCGLRGNLVASKGALGPEEFAVDGMCSQCRCRLCLVGTHHESRALPQLRVITLQRVHFCHRITLCWMEVLSCRRTTRNTVDRRVVKRALGLYLYSLGRHLRSLLTFRRSFGGDTPKQQQAGMHCRAKCLVLLNRILREGKNRAVFHDSWDRFVGPTTFS